MTAPSTVPDAETARRAHSIRSAIVDAVTVWFALLGGLGAWIIHLVLLTSIVQLSCDHPGYLWVMHGATVATLAITGAAAFLAHRLATQVGDESSATEPGRNRFIGQLGLLIAAINALLIIVEEALVLIFQSQRCG